MNIRLEYSINPDDYHAFNRAYWKIRKSLDPRAAFRRLVNLVLFGLVCLLIVVAVILTLIWQFVVPPAAAGPGLAPPTPSPFIQILYPTSWALGVLIFVLAVQWFIRSRSLARLAFKLYPKLAEPHHAEITADTLTITTPGCITTMQWSYFIRFHEAPTAFLLFIGPRHAHILPKRGFPSPADIDQFRAFAQAHIGNTPIGFPVQPPKKT